MEENHIKQYLNGHVSKGITRKRVFILYKILRSLIESDTYRLSPNRITVELEPNELRELSYIEAKYRLFMAKHCVLGIGKLNFEDSSKKLAEIQSRKKVVEIRERNPYAWMKDYFEKVRQNALWI